MGGACIDCEQDIDVPNFLREDIEIRVSGTPEFQRNRTVGQVSIENPTLQRLGWIPAALLGIRLVKQMREAR